MHSTRIALLSTKRWGFLGSRWPAVRAKLAEKGYKSSADPFLFFHGFPGGKSLEAAKFRCVSVRLERNLETIGDESVLVCNIYGASKTPPGQMIDLFLES